MNEKILFSKDSNLWQTPQDFFDAVNKEFHFTTDVAASAENTKCKGYITVEQDALVTPWGAVNWCNPPYNLAKQFVAKAAEAAEDEGKTSVCLVPARTDTKFWYSTVTLADEVRLIKGRLKFIGAKHGTSLNSAPFPSALVIFRPVPQGSFINRSAHFWCWDWKLTASL